MESSPQMYDSTQNGGGGMPDRKSSQHPTSTTTQHGGLKIKGPEGDLAELTTSEISLDLQGLIDDTQFADENLFGDLIEAKKNELNGYVLPSRTSPSISSGHSSPGQDSNPGSYPYRNALAYLPGSVHSGVNYNPHQMGMQQQNGPQVKQEPVESEYVPPCSAAETYQPNSSAYSNGTVSSTTPSTPSIPPMQGFNMAGPPTPLPPLKTFPAVANYMKQVHHNNNNSMSKTAAAAAAKPKNERVNTDEYRRRRERNNVAVRKSREKAKARTRETEERVKILARENERLQKKVELLQEELAVLRSLFSNVGVLPDHIHRELSKHMDNFQQQHNAMSCM